MIWWRKIFIAMAAVGAVFGLVALWWWALVGMSEQVGQAAVFTSIALMFVGGFSSTFPTD